MKRDIKGGIMKKRFMAVFILAVAGLVCWLVGPFVYAGEYPVSFQCKNEKKKGTMSFMVERDGENLVFTVKYPVMINTLIGGFEGGAKTWSPDVTFFLDVDANPGTGMEKDDMFSPGQGGSEFSVEADEVETSVAQNPDGSWINKPVLMADIKKMDDYHDLPEGLYPNWEFKVGENYEEPDWIDPQDSDTMRLVLPLSLFGLKAGDTIIFSGTTPSCNESFPYPGTGSAKITLK